MNARIDEKVRGIEASLLPQLKENLDAQVDELRKSLDASLADLSTNFALKSAWLSGAMFHLQAVQTKATGHNVAALDSFVRAAAALVKSDVEIDLQTALDAIVNTLDEVSWTQTKDYHKQIPESIDALIGTLESKNDKTQYTRYIDQLRTAVQKAKSRASEEEEE